VCLSNDIPAIEAAALFATLVQDVAHGTLTFNNDGSFVYVPEVGFIGSDRFIYRASATDTGPSREVSVSIDVVGPPVVIANEPSIAADAGTTAVNSGQSLSAADGVTVTLTASAGIITQVGSGAWNWSLDVNNATANQTVTITATDSLGGISTTTFDLVVNVVAPMLTQTMRP